MVRSVHAAVATARQHGHLYFASLLPEDRILKAFEAARATWQGWVYTPAITVWVFLAQCLSADHSCREGCYLLRTNLNETDPAVLWKTLAQWMR